MSGPNERATEIAYLIPQVMSDKEAAYLRLMDLARDEDCGRVDFVVEGLIGAGAAAEVIIDITLNHPKAGRFFAREGATRHLFEHFPMHPRVRELAQAELDGRSPPLSILARSYAADGEIRARIASQLTPLPRALRIHILEHLGRTSGPGSEATDILAAYDTESDEEAKVLGVAAYCRSLSESAKPQATEALRHAVDAIGPDMDARRQAAVAGLLVLKRADILLDVWNAAPSQQRIAVPLGLSPNGPLLRVLSEAWSWLSPDDVKRLIGVFREGDEKEVWRKLAVVASGSGALQRDMLAAIHGVGDLTQRAEVLEFMARTIPDAPAFRDAMIAALSKQSRTYGDIAEAHRAAVLFAQWFADDDDAYARLANTTTDGEWSVGAVDALCLSRPASECVGRLSEVLARDGRMARGVVALPIKCVSLRSPELLTMLREVSGSLPMPFEGGFRILADHLVSRLARDGEAREFLLQYLSTDPKPSGKATIPKLLWAAGGATEGLREWCATELKSQLGRIRPECGFDLLEIDVRAVPLSLLDVLATPNTSAD